MVQFSKNVRDRLLLGIMQNWINWFLAVFTVYKASKVWGPSRWSHVTTMQTTWSFTYVFWQLGNDSRSSLGGQRPQSIVLRLNYLGNALSRITDESCVVEGLFSSCERIFSFSHDRKIKRLTVTATSITNCNLMFWRAIHSSPL